jgi:multidrug efflux pump subunit AcrA (membrane-fusion protein)
MSSDDIKPPGKRSLMTAAAGAVLLAGIVVGYGLIDRAESKQEVVDWTQAQAVPTVALAQRLPSSPQQTLSLPGNIQPFNKAAIFARVSDYVKSWDHDIGSPVKAQAQCWPPSMRPTSISSSVRRKPRWQA